VPSALHLKAGSNSGVVSGASSQLPATIPRQQRCLALANVKTTANGNNRNDHFEISKIADLINHRNCRKYPISDPDLCHSIRALVSTHTQPPNAHSPTSQSQPTMASAEDGDEWAKLRTLILSNCTQQGDHVVWNDTAAWQKLPQLWFRSKLRTVSECWAMIKERAEIPRPVPRMVWWRLCEVRGCVEHNVLRQTYLDCVEAMLEGDYMFACQQIDRKSVESQEPTGNPDLKTPCRLWTSELTPAGQARVKGPGGKRVASALVWELVHCCSVPAGFVVRHKCVKHPYCVAEDHLELGTHRDNAQDQVRQGTKAIGQRVGRATLTDAAARQLALSRGDGRTQDQRAEAFHVSGAVVRNIDTGRSWRHVITEAERAVLQAKVVSKFGVRMNPRLTYDQVQLVQRLGMERQSVASIASEMGLTGTKLVRRVLKGQRYAHVPASPEDHLRETLRATQARIRDNVDVVLEPDGSEHWRWRLTKNPAGYGDMLYRGARRAAHIVSVIVFKRNGEEIPKGLQVRHRCRFVDCVNFDCLEIGTPADNTNDKRIDGTMPMGEQHPAATINADIVRAIRASKGSATIAQRARQHGVSFGVVASIDQGTAWGHVTDSAVSMSGMDCEE